MTVYSIVERRPATHVITYKVEAGNEDEALRKAKDGDFETTEDISTFLTGEESEFYSEGEY